MNGKSIGENIRLIIERNNLGKSVYIGDTQGDLDAANMANIPFVFAEYGFGNINCERPSIKSISELADIIESIL